MTDLRILALFVLSCLFVGGIAACELAPSVPGTTTTPTSVGVEATKPVATAPMPTSTPISGVLVRPRIERPASYYLGEIESSYPSIASVLSEFPWIANGITDDEKWSLDHILAIADTDLAVATVVVEMSLFRSEDRSLHRDFLATVRELLIDQPGVWGQIIDRPWFQDGLSDEEAALVVVLPQALKHKEGLFQDLIQHGQLRSESFSLPSGQVNLFTVRRSSLRAARRRVCSNGCAPGLKP